MIALVVTAAVFAAFAIAPMVRRDASPERRCRQAILDLSVERDRRLWEAGSIGSIGAGTEFGCGSGCAGGGCGGCGGGCGGCGG